MIPTFFIEKLARKHMSGFRQRNGEDLPFPVSALDFPKAMLINEYAGSGGDLFPYFFKQQKLGPLIGTRTWGGLVGITGNAPLTDGGGVTAPEFGLYDPFTGEWIAENKGVDPDMKVDLTPADTAKGKDPQLEKAVQYLLDQLKNGKKPWKRPDFPKIGG
jgi:tricorn protease